MPMGPTYTAKQKDLNLPVGVSFYHFLSSRYLELAERHFSADILVPFPDSRVLYSTVPGKIKNSLKIQTCFFNQ